MCGCYLKFNNNFATVATPMSDLTRKHANNNVVWGESCQEEFQQLKRAVTVAPFLIIPDWSKPLFLQTDASPYRLGYTIIPFDSQGEEHPRAFVLKKLLANFDSCFFWLFLNIFGGIIYNVHEPLIFPYSSILTNSVSSLHTTHETGIYFY